MSQVRPGILIAVIVIAVFAAYAFLAPATYRTSALLVVDSVNPAASAALPEPLEAARRLSEAVLDRAMLERLANERAGAGPLAARAEAASLVRHSLEIDTSDAHAFSISYEDTDQDRVQRVCNDLAHHAVARAPLVLAERNADRAEETKREQHTQELAAFLALHPEAAAEAPPGGERSADKDPALFAFHAEKANLERRLREIERGTGSDNPYLDPVQSDPNLLRRRLVEINTALNARHAALDDTSKAPSKVLSPALRSEWKRLLEGLVKTSEAERPSSPQLVARIAMTAPRPSSPIEPNRPLLLFLGVVFGGGLGIAFVLVARAAQQRRSKSSRPPPVSVPAAMHGLTVRLPKAPPVPSALGPSVPSFQPPQPSLGPPIVPTPQTQISARPPPAPPPTQPVGGFGDGSDALQPVGGTAREGDGRYRLSSNPPPAAAPAPRRFASTLVLPPAQNPVLLEDPMPDPVLASAAQVWDEQIRAHAVPGFAVVRPGSDPPPPAAVRPPAPAPAPAPVPASSQAPPPASRGSHRPSNPMKVTRPLGSFLPQTSTN